NDFLRDHHVWVKKNCDFIPFPIFLNQKGPVNAIDAPWHRDHWPSTKEKLFVPYQSLQDPLFLRDARMPVC
ncbi:MAG: hypothetical protein KAW12_20330, partial [Candidatus Aminicenantes bacterium]|nr:hypothetical protein [Candidatus Aminicenantes bacterium]